MKKATFHCGYIAVGIVLFLIELELLEIVSMQIQFKKEYGDSPGYPYLMMFSMPFFIGAWILLFGIPVVYVMMYSFLGLRLHKKGYITKHFWIDWFFMLSPSLVVFIFLVTFLYLYFGYGA